jgi:hypothetical protein
VSDQQQGSATAPRLWGFRRLAVIAALAIGLVIAVSLALQTVRLFERPQLGLGPVGTLHSALLTNGQVYYGTLQQVAPNYIVLSRVFYVQSSLDEKTGARSNKLVDRAATDWHGPSSMSIPLDKIVFIEVVGPGSTVAKLIAEADAKR